MKETTFEDLLGAGVHLGHLTKKWNPRFSPYIYGVRAGIHIIDLHKTLVQLNEAALALRQLAKTGKKILFVGTKKQAAEIIQNRLPEVAMPYVTERWPGGMLTNFGTIRRSIKKMQALDKMFKDGTADTMSKRERLQLQRQKEKMEKLFGSIVDMTKIPAAIFVVDIKKEHIAVREAKKLGIPVFAMVDTNSNPDEVDHPIPANDDAISSIDLIISVLTAAMQEGLVERKAAAAASKENTAAEAKKESDMMEETRVLRSRKKKTETPEQQ